MITPWGVVDRVKDYNDITICFFCVSVVMKRGRFKKKNRFIYPTSVQEKKRKKRIQNTKYGEEALMETIVL